MSTTTQMIMLIVTGVLGLLYNVFLYSSVLLKILVLAGHRRSRILNLAWYWSKWPALAFLIIYMPVGLLLGRGVPWWAWLFEAWAFGAWWYCKDLGDDDDHKKLKKKLKQKVAVLHGKLIVVPEPA